MRRRARLLAVVATVACGALGVISATQTWLTVVLDDGAGHVLEVPGASAIPMLTPLSLAVLALGAAQSIVGFVLRCVFGALSIVIGGVLAWQSARVAFEHPVGAFASVVTEATGITGDSSVAALVSSVSATAWPVVTLVTWVALVGAGAFTLATARAWAGTGRRFRTGDAARPTTAAGSRPHDAIDDWDDLSRGEDPTA
jgi:hypothetical protein